jgi:hypothetical protein
MFDETTAGWIAWGLETYLGFGLVVAPLLIFRAAQRLDRQLAESGAGMRLVLLPGGILLWPVLALRAWRGDAASREVLAAPSRGDIGGPVS